MEDEKIFGPEEYSKVNGDFQTWVDNMEKNPHFDLLSKDVSSDEGLTTITVIYTI